MTAIPYNSYGPAGAWCWIAGFRSPSRLTYYIPILLAEIYCLYIFFKGPQWSRLLRGVGVGLAPPTAG